MEALAARKASIEKMVESLQAKQAEQRKAGAGTQALHAQLTENTLVREELDKSASDARVFKLVGPVLIPQDLDEAKSTVGTRISFIQGEVAKAQDRVKALEAGNQEAQVAIVRAQEEFQAAVQEAAKADPSLFAGAR
jgi:prefoldin beta subunit